MTVQKLLTYVISKSSESTFFGYIRPNALWNMIEWRMPAAILTFLFFRIKLHKVSYDSNMKEYYQTNQKLNPPTPHSQIWSTTLLYRMINYLHHNLKLHIQLRKILVHFNLEFVLLKILTKASCGIWLTCIHFSLKNTFKELILSTRAVQETKIWELIMSTITFRSIAF